MIMTTIQKIIRIGSSKGVTLPAKQLKQIELVIRKKGTAAKDDATQVAESLLSRYNDDFKNLSQR